MLLAVTSVAQADEASVARKNLVKPESFASVSAIKPGEPFKVGVRFEIEPAWHIYWINPGESGQATTVDWKFPPGFEVGKVEYPVPVNFPQPGDVQGYGYLHGVMLMATVTPPTDLAPGTVVSYAAQAEWLVCRDVCIPGKANLETTLTVGESAARANEALFTEWTANLPQWELGKLENVVEKTASVQKDAEGGTIELAVDWRGQPPAGIEWFVGTPGSVLQKDAEAVTEGNRSKFSFRAVPVPAEAVKVPVVVAYTDAAGKRQGLEFSFNLGKKQAAAKGQAAASRIDPQ